MEVLNLRFNAVEPHLSRLESPELAAQLADGQPRRFTGQVGEVTHRPYVPSLQINDLALAGRSENRLLASFGLPLTKDRGVDFAVKGNRIEFDGRFEQDARGGFYRLIPC